MSIEGKHLTRRNALKLTGGAVAAGFTVPWAGSGHLRSHPRHFGQALPAST